MRFPARPLAVCAWTSLLCGCSTAPPALDADLPDAAGGAARADAGHVATDTHVARWALDAGGRYDECRRRLDALIGWHEEGAPR